MKTNLLPAAAVIPSPVRLNPVTRKMVLTRARELAVSNGRSSYDTVETDFLQAKRELMEIPSNLTAAPTEAAPK